MSKVSCQRLQQYRQRKQHRQQYLSASKVLGAAQQWHQFHRLGIGKRLDGGVDQSTTATATHMPTSSSACQGVLRNPWREACKRQTSRVSTVGVEPREPFAQSEQRPQFLLEGLPRYGSKSYISHPYLILNSSMLLKNKVVFA